MQTPLIHSELPADWRVIEALTENPTAELRAAILSLDRADEPVAVCRRYEDTTVEAVAVKAAADLGSLFLDGLADGIRIDAPHLSEKEIAEIEPDDPAGSPRADVPHRIHRLPEPAVVRFTI